MRCVLETFPGHTVYQLLGFSCMFSMQEEALEPGALGPMGWVPRSITLKGLCLLTEPQQTSQPQECPPLCLIQLCVYIWSIQVASQPLNEFCKNFSFTVFVSWVFKSNLFYNGVQLLFTAVFMSLYTHLTHFQRDIKPQVLRFLRVRYILVR